MLAALRRGIERCPHEEPAVDEEEQARVLAERAQRFYLMDDD
jgi:hypothetical protein